MTCAHCGYDHGHSIGQYATWSEFDAFAAPSIADPPQCGYLICTACWGVSWCSPQGAVVATEEMISREAPEWRAKLTELLMARKSGSEWAEEVALT